MQIPPVTTCPSCGSNDVATNTDHGLGASAMLYPLFGCGCLGLAAMGVFGVLLSSCGIARDDGANIFLFCTVVGGILIAAAALLAPKSVTRQQHHACRACGVRWLG